MMKRLTYLKIVLGVCVFMALYFSFNIPIPSIQKTIQTASLSAALVILLLIMRYPEEKSKRLQNGILFACLIGMLVTMATV